ncbi:MAG: TRAP transporter permease [Proteobacteria bacterium]|nr:TRAP transporter permease [Pseudomonadota bacterium]
MEDDRAASAADGGDRKADGPAAADEGSPRLSLGGWWGRAATAVAVAMSLFHLYTGGTIPFPPMVQRAIHLALALALVFLLYPARRAWGKRRPSWPSLALGALGVGACLYILAEWQELTLRTVDQTRADLTFGVIATLVVLEAARRTLGPALSVVAVAFIGYAFFGDLLPDPLGHAGMDLERFLSVIYGSDQGIFGIAIGVSATYVFLFVLFAELLLVLGGGQFFIDIAQALLGGVRGGPAKVAVVSSALMGTISGSAVANVVGTGSITIPLMKATGYAPRFAGAVEAVASTGGQIMPPVMSAAAFVMAEILSTSYGTIVVAAALPALLYYLAIFVAVDLEAAKRGLKGVARENLPSARAALRGRGHVLIPLAVLVWLLVAREYSATLSVFWSIVTMIAVDALHQLWLTRRIDGRRYLRALARAPVSAVPVVAACAGAGIITGVISGSGLGLSLSGLLIELSGESTAVLLVVTMVASLILGMGLSTVPCYIVLAVLAAPALVARGVEPMAAHLFVLYFGVISVITPPVALAAYAAAGIAREDPFKVGFTAFRLGIVAFLIPYYFVYNPTLLWRGPLPEILGASLTAIVGVVTLVMGLQGYTFARCGLVGRGLLIGAAFLLIHPGLVTDLAGGALVLVALGGQWLAARAATRVAPR